MLGVQKEAILGEHRNEEEVKPEMNMHWKFSVVAFALSFVCSSVGHAQTFDILGAGELDLDSDQITDSTSVTKYFGMNIAGSGTATIRVIVGDQTRVTTENIRVNPTQLTSFLFSADLVDSIGLPFRRGVIGDMTIEVLDEQGLLNDQVSLNIAVTRPKSACREHPSPRLKRCAPLNLAKAKKKLRGRLAQKFADSIRGPIVLEP